MKNILIKCIFWFICSLFYITWFQEGISDPHLSDTHQSVHALHCTPIDVDGSPWKTSNVIRPFSVTASILCSLFGEDHWLHGITPDHEEEINYEYSPRHNRLLIDHDRNKTVSKLLKFKTRCHIIAYKQECFIEVGGSPPSSSEKSYLFIFVSELIYLATVPLYLAVISVAIWLTFVK